MGFKNICPTRDISHLLLRPFNKSLIHDFFTSVDKVNVTAFSGTVISLILTLCCAPILCCYCCPAQVKCCAKHCIDATNKKNKLVIHQRVMDERRLYKDLLNSVSHPRDRLLTLTLNMGRHYLLS